MRVSRSFLTGIVGVSVAFLCLAGTRDRKIEVGKGMGYCVTYLGERVDVPLHRPDAERLDELRGSIRNALTLIANQLDVKAAVEQDHERRGALAGKALKLKAQLVTGVRFAGETSHPTMIGDNGGVTCTCATLMDSGGTMPSGYQCGGPCGNCWSCK